MILHLRIEDGVLVPVAEIIEWASQVRKDYFEFASVLEEGVHDVTPRSFEGGESRHRVQVFPDGTGIYGVYKREELQEPRLFASQPGQKTQVISPDCPTFLISLKTRTSEVIFVLAVIFYYPNWEMLQPDLSQVSKN